MADIGAQFEAILARVREQLNKERIRLWLPPFTVEGQSRGNFSEELVSQFSSSLGVDEAVIVEALENLRLHALEKLEAKKRFSELGEATVKARLVGSHKKIVIHTPLKITGADLKTKLSKETGIDPLHMKLICNGNVIDEDNILENQNIRNNSQLLVIHLSESEIEARQKQQLEQEMASQVSRTRHAAEVLSKRMDGGESLREKYFLEIRDQEGRPLSLPESERKALALAMTLHEKGKSILKQNRNAEALLYLLEADKEFRQCRAEILNAVDNYAILCMDVVWCYLCLKSISDLPDAEKRLCTSQECFEKSYGPNLERLKAVQGGAGRERALFVRLHTLQAVCAYHTGCYGDALSLLRKAESGMARLRIGDNQLTQLVSMGFTVREARLGLRACDGDVTHAIDYITRRKQEFKERQEREKEERKQKRIQRKLGKTASGEWVNLSSFEALMSMGFSRQTAIEALRQSDNSMDKALQILEDHPELLHLPPDQILQDFEPSDELVAQIVSMGFNIDVIREALKRFGGNSRRAIEELVSTGGVLPSCSSNAESSQTTSDSEDSDVEQAVEDLVPDITKDNPDAHLDLTLDDEASIIAEYKALLLSCGYGETL
ncbi:NEDD8 ultimate buster 1 [Exaiptasia diaphana]|uniref:NEDD8 ultimate buster 1 n=1 Tax=Exaiptasia diaphana TaxID=2652724 RepID=A0A913XVE8_EXADI|nr:NEDD8 ultimate buster 1 [Exaiptasia diaphana]KXJ08773.1 NEDD8 ultimate buster 1 [Exaiptasia diaphana]